MRVSNDFILREIAGEHILIPVGAAAEKFNGMIAMNEVGRYLFDLLSEERTVEELAAMLTEKYDVSFQTALTDAAEYLQQLRDVGALVEDQ